MKKLKSLPSKFQIKSLYVKWTLLFTTLIIISQLFTFGIISYSLIPDVTANIEAKLCRKAEFIQNLHMQGMEITEEALTKIGDTDIEFYLSSVTSFSDLGSEYGESISLSMLQRALNGEIVTLRLHNNKMPACLVAVNDQIALMTPNVLNNELATFINGMRESIIIGGLIGSISIVVALIAIIKPIRKVTTATREVAKGNFDVQLKTKSVDEIGELITNFNLMTTALQKNEYLKKDFVSSVSHEFKTPITSIEGFAKLLRSDELAKEQIDEYTGIILKETKRLSKLSSNLLRLSILDSSEFEPAKEEFYLDEQIRSVILLLENQWTEKNIELDIEMDELLFYGNQELLSHVWINLIQNAVKFSPHNGVIAIRLKEAAEAVSVTIADQGAGISPEHGDKVFDRFYKADKSRSKEGSGLGLSIVKRIVEISKGCISFADNQGKGTVFLVTLPKGRLLN